MIDIHSHILPQIDDGPQKIEETNNILNLYKELGFTKVIPTPHFYPSLFEKDNSEIKDKLDTESLNNREIIGDFAREYYVDFVFLNKLKEEKFIKTYPDGKHILIEFSFTVPPVNWQSLLFEIQSTGYLPILAHPERYHWLKEMKSFIIEFKNRGGLLQGNIGSFENGYGSYARKNAVKLIKEDLYDFIATDTHSYEQLKIIGRKILPRIIKKYGEIKINYLLNDNPRKLLQ